METVRVVRFDGKLRGERVWMPDLVDRYWKTARSWRSMKWFYRLTFQWSAAREAAVQQAAYESMAEQGAREGFWC